MPKNSLCHLKWPGGRGGRSMALRRAFIGMCWPCRGIKTTSWQSRSAAGNQDSAVGNSILTARIKIPRSGPQFSRWKLRFCCQELNSQDANQDSAVRNSILKIRFNILRARTQFAGQELNSRAGNQDSAAGNSILTTRIKILRWKSKF